MEATHIQTTHVNMASSLLLGKNADLGLRAPVEHKMRRTSTFQSLGSATRESAGGALQKRTPNSRLPIHGSRPTHGSKLQTLDTGAYMLWVYIHVHVWFHLHRDPN